MIIETLPMEITAEDFSEAENVRSPGLHLSTIISELDKIAHGTRYPETDDQTKQRYFSMGFFWEQFIARIWRETAVKKRDGQLVRPGEFLLDGIAMSPDAIDLTDWTLEEYKATYLSSSRPIEDKCFWAWSIQMKCYCKAIGTREARLRVWFINGDYKHSGPQTKAWQFHFTDRDVEEAWEMCRNHARAKGWI